MAEQALSAAIAAAPEDDAPRRVYADWLEQRGRAAEAAAIRHQLAAAADPADHDAMRRALRSVPSDQSVERDWVELRANDVIIDMRRGLPDAVTIRGDGGEAPLALLQRRAPWLRALSLWGQLDPYRIDAAAGQLPALRRLDLLNAEVRALPASLRELRVSGAFEELLPRLQPLRQLTALTLPDTRSPVDVSRLASLPALRRLTLRAPWSRSGEWPAQLEALDLEQGALGELPPGLTSLRLCRDVYGGGTPLPRLREAELWSDRVDLGWLLAQPALEQLAIASLPEAPDALRRLAALDRVALSWWGDAESWWRLARLRPRWRALHLELEAMDGYRELRQLTDLRWLRVALGGASETQLVLEGEPLEALEHLTGLETLELGGGALPPPGPWMQALARPRVLRLAAEGHALLPEHLHQLARHATALEELSITMGFELSPHHQLMPTLTEAVARMPSLRRLRVVVSEPSYLPDPVALRASRPDLATQLIALHGRHVLRTARLHAPQPTHFASLGFEAWCGLDWI